jgi:hypothetical protein
MKEIEFDAAGNFFSDTRTFSKHSHIDCTFQFFTVQNKNKNNEDDVGNVESMQVFLDKNIEKKNEAQMNSNEQCEIIGNLKFSQQSHCQNYFCYH